MTTAPQSRLPFIFILATLTLDAMGIGLILPVMPDLIRDIDGGGISDAALWGGILATVFAVMQFLFGPFLGSLSDRYGRRPILLISLLVMAVDYVVMAVAGTMWLLLAARIVGGITAATQATAAAYIADISPPDKKAQNFGLVGAAFGAGFVFGPMIGGLLAEFGHRAPFYAAAGLATLNLIFGYFVLPETVTDRIRRPFTWGRANPFGSFKALSKLSGVGRLLLLVLIYEFAFIVYPATWAYFTQERLGWEPAMVGISLASFGISMALVQGFLIRWIIPKFGMRRTITYGFCFNFLAFLVLTMLDNGLAVLLFTPITALGAVVTPALQGMLSRKADDNQQGELQGVIASTKSVAMILSPLVMTQIFYIFTQPGNFYLPGAAFGLSALLMVVCLIVFVTRGKSA
ncbi:TCR/Tet family MFS transporter [Algirhabdus cladophorae]|uniref:TCR/Tet family MFS transporter n=1 Tax=Algirhabdus cladophorae TaxID=3377108 RepID=UPI003B84AB91